MTTHRRRQLLSSIAVLLACMVAGTGHSGPRAQAVTTIEGWTLVLDRPTGAKYEDFAFPDAKHGWLVSALGDILHSDDGGATWNVQATGMGSLRSIDFIDDKRGFAGNLRGVLYGTTDGGITWNDISGTLPHRTSGFCGMTHVGEKEHIVGRYIGAVADYYFSPDGGKTWTWADLRELAQALVEIQFLNDRVGLIGGMANSAVVNTGPATILKTTDGGLHWHTVFTDTGGRGYAWKIWPVTSTLIYASMQSQDGTYRVAKSTDAGDTWTVQVATTGHNEGPGVQGVGFLDANTGWIGGFFNGMYMTKDGGNTWSPVSIPDRNVNRFEHVGNSMFTAGSRGILRYDSK